MTRTRAGRRPFDGGRARKSVDYGFEKVKRPPGFRRLALHVSVSLNLLGRDSLITRARNTLVPQFMTVPQATHLMFIDADIGFEPELVHRMLTFDEDVVGGMYPAKALNWNPPDKVAHSEPPNLATLNYVGRFCERDALERRGPFATGVYAATGFMMIKRQAIAQLVAACPQYAYTSDHVYMPDKAERKCHALFECRIDPDKANI